MNLVDKKIVYNRFIINILISLHLKMNFTLYFQKTCDFKSYNTKILVP